MNRSERGEISFGKYRLGGKGSGTFGNRSSHGRKSSRARGPDFVGKFRTEGSSGKLTASCKVYVACLEGKSGLRLGPGVRWPIGTGGLSDALAAR